MRNEKRVSGLRYAIRHSVKKYGRAKTRARCKHHLNCYVCDSAAAAAYVADYKQACRDVLGGEW